jgi:hypothetical protein
MVILPISVLLSVCNTSFLSLRAEVLVFLPIVTMEDQTRRLVEKAWGVWVLIADKMTPTSRDSSRN